MDSYSKKHRILIVDDVAENVELLDTYLQSSGYEVLTAASGHEAIRITYDKRPDLILLDIMMPELDGYEVCKLLKNDESTMFIPIVLITALNDIEDKIKGLEAGADDFLSKPINRLELMARIGSLLKIKSLHDDLDTSENIIFTLVLALEAKDPDTKGHSERVAILAQDLAREIGASVKEQKKIYKAGILHDIGKIGVPEAILNKKSGLEEKEYAEVRNHPIVGARICGPLKSLVDVIPAIKHHHELFDGSGQPDGLAGEEIPLGARVIAIADSYDAMTSARPYRSPATKEKALKSLMDNIDSGQWDPSLIKIFIRMMKR